MSRNRVSRSVQKLFSPQERLSQRVFQFVKKYDICWFWLGSCAWQQPGIRRRSDDDDDDDVVQHVEKRDNNHREKTLCGVRLIPVQESSIKLLDTFKYAHRSAAELNAFCTM